MTLGDKKKALNALAQVKHLQADKELLKVKKPHSHIFKRKYSSPERTHREVLWDLFSVANLLEIKTNREKHAAANAPAETAEEKAVIEQISEEDKEAAAAKAAKANEAKLKLAELDLENKPNYKVMQSIIAALDIETADRKSETFTAALVAYKSTMVIAETVSPEELKKAQDEKEGLKENLEETTEELEETKEQLEETQEQLDEANEELDKSKKNES